MTCNLTPRRKGATITALFLGVSLLSVSACSSEPAPDTEATSAAADTTIERLDPALDGIIAPGTNIEKVAGGFEFVEGPVWVDGELRFSDLMGNKLYAVGDDGTPRMLLENSGGVTDAPVSQYPGSNGAVVDKDGTVLMAQHGARRIVRVAPDLTITPFIERDAEGRRLNSPNDLTVSPDGTLWFTDPPFGLAGADEDPAKEIPYNGVYRYKDGKAVAVITDLPNPNGIGFSPDGTKLYVSNSGPDMFINVYDVDAEGEVSNGRKLIGFDSSTGSGVSDGMKVDTLGNIWASGPGGFRIITPDGRVLGQIKTPDEAQANLAWGGEDGRTAYITAASNVYRVQALNPGMRLQYGE